MADYTQQNRPLRITTALGPDAVLLTAMNGHEAISDLFRFELELLAPAAKQVDFAGILGKPATVEMDLLGGTRCFQGIIARFGQGERGPEFTRYFAELVPNLWLWTKRSQSRIFSHVPLPEILKKVLDGLAVTWDIQGEFKDREYCVQYRETDFNFASRRMEEEGIFYYHTHPSDNEELVVSNNPTDAPAVPITAEIIFEDVLGGVRDEGRIYEWRKSQQLRSGKYTLWDHHFQNPHKHLDAERLILDSIAAGTVTHTLNLPGSDKLEVYDYPGNYAMRFDEVDRGGGANSDGLSGIDVDNRRAVTSRMEAETAGGLVITGAGTCGQLTPGHHFYLQRHPDADGKYFITSVTHSARLPANYRPSEGSGFEYSNRFQCIPAGLSFRPERTTRRPTVHGCQTAVVVGPPGEEIFPDKFGRVKVHFHWDREDASNEDRSCWLRVATPWAGTNWGMVHIPRIGQEVVVDFLEGDPDRPLIMGSVYNADMMPPWELPANKTQSGILSRSSPGGSPANANAIRFEDKKGSEQLWIHAEKNQDIEVENDETHWVGHDRQKTIDRDETTLVKRDRTETVNRDETITIDGNRTEHVKKDEKITIDGNRTEKVGKDESITIDGNRSENVAKDESITISGNRTEKVSKDESITISGKRTENVSKDESITIGGSRKESVSKDESITISGGRTESVGKDESVSITGGRTLSVGKDDGQSIKGGQTITIGKALSVTATDSITLTVGKASITMKKDGTITINGKDITVTGSGEITAKASKNMTLKGKKILEN